MKLLTIREMRKVKMTQLHAVFKLEKIIFPIAMIIFVILLIPHTSPLIYIPFISLPGVSESSHRLCQCICRSHGRPCVPGDGKEGSPRQLPAHARNRHNVAGVISFAMATGFIIKVFGG